MTWLRVRDASSRTFLLCEIKAVTVRPDEALLVVTGKKICSPGLPIPDNVLNEIMQGDSEPTPDNFLRAFHGPQVCQRESPDTDAPPGG